MTTPHSTSGRSVLGIFAVVASVLGIFAVVLCGSIVVAPVLGILAVVLCGSDVVPASEVSLALSVVCS